MRRRIFTVISLMMIVISLVNPSVSVLAEEFYNQVAANTNDRVETSSEEGSGASLSLDQSFLDLEEVAVGLGEQSSLDLNSNNGVLRGPILRTSANVTNKVDVSGLQVRINNGNGFYDFIKDGQLVPGALGPMTGNTIRFEYNWSISKENLETMNAGDYFYFDLPKDFFSYKDTDVVNLTDSSTGEILGTQQIIGGKIKITLTSNAMTKEALKNGYVFADGKIEKSGEQIVIQVEDGIKLPEFDIGGGGNVTSNETPNTDTNLIVKNGTQVSGKDVANWDIMLNTDNLRKRYNGLSYDTLKNSFFIDELQEGQTFSSLKIQTVLYTATSDGKMSNNTFLYTDVGKNNQIVSKPPTNEGTLDEYKETLKNAGQPAWGVFDNTVVIYFGDLPSEKILLPSYYRNGEYAEIRKLLDQQLKEGKINDTGHRKTLYHYKTGVEDQVISFQVTIQADVAGDPSKIRNQAKLVYDGQEVISNEKEISFQKISGGVEAVESKSIKIIKKDDEGTLLQDVVFKLTKLSSGTESYEDYVAPDGIGTLERKTDEKGEVTFGKLAAGQYKIVEVAGLDGFSSPVYSPGDQFEIADTDKQGFLINVVNPKIKPISYSLEASKELTGKTLTAGQFNFELVDAEGHVLQTKSNDAAGKIYFDEIVYEKAGVYTYTIREVLGGDSTITYDESVYQVSVKVEDKDGQLKAAATYEGNPLFENSYKPEPGAVVIEASKELTGKTLTAGQFNFELVDAEGNVLQTKSNDAAGKIYFDEIVYDKVGVYTYTIREVLGGDSTITYDASVYRVSVKVEDEDGLLKAVATYEGNPLFENSYKPEPGAVVIEASKELTGKTLTTGQFNFELVDAEGNVLQTKSNDVAGKIYFDEIVYDKVGVYTYTIREVLGGDSTITYDTTNFKVSVKVEDEDGQLKAAATYEGNPLFENSYKPEPGAVVIEASKELTGKTLTAGQFNFELVDAEGHVLQTKSNDAAGKIYFDEIVYDKAGVYTYTIREVLGGDSTITYDTTNFKVSVKVEDKDGQLKASATYEGNPLFENSYKPEPGAVVIEASKELTGKTLTAGQFNFELVDAEGNVLQTKSNDAAGKIYFDEIVYDKAGVYTYTIREVLGGDSTITYDASVYRVSVNVEDEDGQLKASATYEGNPLFENSYKPLPDEPVPNKPLPDNPTPNNPTPEKPVPVKPQPGVTVIEASKELTGKTLTAGQFNFELVDAEGNVLQTKSNDAAGKIYFNGITYDKAGVYTYTIREVLGADSTITYDESVYQVSVKVVEKAGKLETAVTYEGNPVFKNRYFSPSLGKVTLEKIDSQTSEGLADAEFELQDYQGKTVRTGIVTGADGKVVIGNLELDDYQLVEVKAPAGYVLDQTPVRFSVTDVNKTSSEEIVIRIKNTKESRVKKNPKQSLPAAGDGFNQSLIVWGMFCIVVAIVLYAKRRRYKGSVD